MRPVACPIALHPEGAPLRLAVFEHPLAGWQLVKGGLRNGETPAAGAARELFEESGLETRSAIPIGQSDIIQDDARWHFALCRVTPPVRDQWQHLCADDGGHLFRFEWMPLEGRIRDGFDPMFQRALGWIRRAL